jgi:hypothetical protein
LFMYQSKIIMGSALLRSLRNQNKVTLLTVLSQTDLHRKLGGTNSSLRLWPRPDAHVNINPDLYTAGLPPPEKSDATLPAFETISGRRILTLLSIDLSHASALHKDEIRKLIDAHLADAIGFLRQEIGKDHQMIFGHESESEVFDLIAFLYTSARQTLRGPELHLLVHSGLGYNDGNVVKGEVIDVLTAMSQEKSGRILVTEEVAALMCLNPKRFHLAYSGILTHDSISRTVYEVTVA